MAKRGADVLQLLANPTNRAILGVLAVEPQYPRRLAEIVGLTEDEASRRLRAFEKLGLTEAGWANVGKTVRLYRLASDRITVRLTSGGIVVDGLGESAAPALEIAPAAEAAPGLARFVGRARELAQLAALLDARRAVCIHGLGGVGKSSLAAKLGASTGRPLAWHTLAPGESGALLLTRLATALRAIAPPEHAARLLALRSADDGNLVIAALAAAADASGAVVVLDRFESAAEGAGDVAAALARNLTEARLVVASRAWPRELPRDVVASYRLDGMDEADARLLLETLAPGAPTTGVHARTRGHPLALVLLAQGGAPSGEDLGGEDGIRQFLLTDVLPQLPDAEREVLVSLSVLRGPFLPEEAEAVCERKHVRDALLRLEARGLVLRAGPTFALHDLVRAFASEAAPEAKKLHARAAKTLLAAGEPAKALDALHHLLDAGDLRRAAALVREELVARPYRFLDHGLRPGYHDALARLEGAPTLRPDERAAVLVETALAAVDRREGEEARKRIEEATRLAPRDATLAPPLLVARARLLHLQGHARDAAKTYAEAGALAKDESWRLRCLLDEAFCIEETDEDALDRYERAIEAGRASSDLRLLSLAYAGAARAAGRKGRADAAARAQEALRLARVAGYLRGEASVLMALSEQSIAAGDVEAGLRHAKRYLEVAETLGDPFLRTCALVDQAFLLQAARDHARAEEAATRALGLARSLSNAYYGLCSSVVIAEARLARGAHADALAAIEPVLAEAPATWPAILARGWRAAAKAHAAMGLAQRARDAEARAAALDDGSPWSAPAPSPSIPSGGHTP